MNRDELTFLNFEIRGLGEKFAACIAAHHEAMQAMVKRGFESLLQSGRMEQIVQEELAKEMSSAVRRAVSSPDVAEALKRTILAALERPTVEEGQEAEEHSESLGDA